MQHYLTTLQQTIQKHWDKEALCNFGGEKFTYGALAENIAKFHLFFEGIGLKKGDKVALCAKNTARWGVSFLSINTYEAVVVPLLCDFLPESVAHLVAHSEAKVLFTDKEIWEKIAVEDRPKLIAVVNVSDFTLLQADEKAAKVFESLSELFNAKYPMGFSAANVSFPTGNDKDTAVINYTSGTTSAPKGVILRYECFSMILDFSFRNMPCTPDESVVSMLPMGHIYGLAIEFLFPVNYGVSVYYLGKTPSPTLLLKAMKEVKPFMVVTVPLVLEKVYRSSVKPVVSKFPMNVITHLPIIGGAIYRKIGKKLEQAFGGNVRAFILGGAALNPGVEKAFRKMHIPYTVGYGMTEASPLLTWAAPGEYAFGSCGKTMDCVQLRVDSEDPEHIAGELQAKGINVCSGYFNNPEASENAFTDDGYLRTGDLGIIDKDRNVFIKGRSKNMILSANGQNIYPEEVEAIINAQDYVAESVVVDRNGKLVALIYLDSDSIKKAGLDAETVSDIPETVMANSNKVLPSYSKIAKIEVMLEPFEKTPKMSIKRFLYK